MIITPLHKWLVEGGETHSRSNEKSDIVWGGGGGGGAAAEGLGQSVGSSETKLCAKTGGGDGECQGRHAQLTHRWGDNGSDPRQRGNISLSKPPRNDRTDIRSLPETKGEMQKHWTINTFGDCLNTAGQHLL